MTTFKLLTRVFYSALIPLIACIDKKNPPRCQPVLLMNIKYLLANRNFMSVILLLSPIRKGKHAKGVEEIRILKITL